MEAQNQQTLQFPKGVYTVLVTPFNDDDSVDYESIDKWVDEQQDSNVAGLVLLGTTSESPTLTRDEQFKIVKRVWEHVSKFVEPKFVVAGVGGNNTQETLDFARSLTTQKLCDGLMVTVPSYNKPTHNGIYEHFVKICSHPDVRGFPVIMYNVPGRTSVNMEPKTIFNIVESCNNVVAIKEASGSIDQLIEIMNTTNIQVFAGDDKLVLDVMVHGGCGVISVAGNVIPNLMSRLVKLCTDGDFSVARLLYYESNLPNFIRLLFCETNPIPVKYMLYCTELYPNYTMRLPMTQLSENRKSEVRDAVQKMKVFEVIHYTVTASSKKLDNFCCT
jgi:4-hydroxy-tetrahydrodipicolinate synthase